jgi:glycosyltransferase involved in cell wall biosynthesis
MSDDRPLVTAVVPTFDRPETLVRAVESVVAQAYRPLELVVVDDNPTRPAEELLADVDTGSLTSVEFVREGGHAGAGAARNTGIEAARGKYVAFLDDDDYWVEGRVERAVSVMERDPEVGLVYTGTRENREDGERTHTPPEVADVTAALCHRNVVGSMSVVTVRTELARETPIDEELPAWEDIDWFLNLSLETRFERIPEPLVVYDFTSENRLSEDVDRTYEAARRFVEKNAHIASERGPLAERAMRGWAAFRAGTDGFNAGDYGGARRHFLRAVWAYPFERRFWTYLFVSLGGTTTHRVARAVRGRLAL